MRVCCVRGGWRSLSCVSLSGAGGGGSDLAQERSPATTFHDRTMRGVGFNLLWLALLAGASALRPASPAAPRLVTRLSTSCGRRRPFHVVSCSAGGAALQEQTTTTDAAAILAGTAIGGGFLALPAVTSPLGFLPSVAALTGIWLFLALAGVCYAEATAAVLAAEQAASPAAAGDEAPVVSVLSITRATFGNRASIVCSLAFAAQMLAVVTAQVLKGACYSLLTTHYSLLTTHYSLPTTHYSRTYHRWSRARPSPRR